MYTGNSKSGDGAYKFHEVVFEATDEYVLPSNHLWLQKLILQVEKLVLPI